jgi:co-chaperonin GroES (HSP10)
MKLFNQRILVRPIAPPERTDKGIILPDAEKRLQFHRGEVVLMADDCGIGIAKGDTVVYNSRGATFTLKGEDLQMMTSDNIIAKE